MRRTFNYTGRKRIPATAALFAVRKDSQSGRRYFDATLGLGELELPPEGRVHVEAYYKRSLVRFDFGTVGAVVVPADRWLEEIDFGEHLSFRLKVVDQSGVHGRILAMVADVAPTIDDTAEAARKSLLPVDHRDDLESEIWRLAFTSLGPVLEVNNQIPGIREIVRNDRVFVSLVMPQAYRSILERIVLTEEMSQQDATTSSWQGRWLLFSQQFGTTRLNSEFTLEEKTAWIDEAVAAFAKKLDACGHFTRSLDTTTEEN